ncbi:hypothetical protein L0F63_005728 [Massospora cicadina]|nr:hypothetical protein L0F63_005728 [Massospora cicadina]
MGASEAGGSPWQQFLPQQDRETVVGKFVLALRQHGGVANDRILTIARSFEHQCYNSAGSLQLYYTMCYQKVAHIANASQQQKAMSQQMQNQMQPQPINPMQAQKLQQMQQANIASQLQGQSMQNLQAQQLQNRLLLQKQLQMQQQGGNNLQSQQIQTLQQQKLLAQMSQNMGMNVPNTNSFLGNNLTQGGINPPNLGRPRPNQPGISTGSFPGVSMAPAMGIQSPSNNVQPMRPPAGMVNGMSPFSNITPQQFAQLSTNPQFIAALQQRGLNLQQAKSMMLSRLQNAALASQMNANASNQADAITTPTLSTNLQNTVGNAINAGPKPVASPAFPQNSMEPVSGQHNAQMNMPMGHGLSPVARHRVAASDEQFRAGELDSAASLERRMRFRSQGQGASEGRPNFQNLPAPYQQLLSVVEMAKVELEPKVKALMESISHKGFPIREDVSQEEREQISAFFPLIPVLLKTIDELLPYFYVLAQKLDIPKHLILFKAVLEAQDACKPQICLTLDLIDKIKTQVSMQSELVKMRVQRAIQMAQSGDNSMANMAASAQPGSPNEHDTSSLQPNLMTSGKLQPGSFASGSPKPAAAETSNLINLAAQGSDEANMPTALHPPMKAEAQASGSLSSQIPNPDITLRLPIQSSPASVPTPRPNMALQEELSENSLAAHASTNGIKSLEPAFNLKHQEFKPASPKTALERVEAEMANSRTQFKDRHLDYAIDALRKLRDVDGKCLLQVTPMKGIGSAKFGSSLLFHYSDVSAADSIFKTPSGQRRTAFGFGDLPQD